MKSLLDPTFRYVKACDTDLRKTFARVRREMAGKAEPTRLDIDRVVLTLALPPAAKKEA